MQLPELRTPFARATVPVVAGLAFFAVLGLILWGAAAWISGNGEQVRLGDTRFEVGRVDLVADSVDGEGPHLYPDLTDPDGEKSVVLDHQGGTDNRGWTVYRPFPADRPGTDCFATQTPGSDQFTDCDGRLLNVQELQTAPDVTVVIENQVTLFLEFAGARPD